MKSNLITYIILITCISCGVSGEDYVSYLKDPKNGLIKKVKFSNAVYQMQYRPIDLMVAREALKSNISKRALRNQFGNLDYFLLELSNTSAVVDEKASFYYAYQFEKDIYKIIEGDTIRPSLYQLDQGINGSRHLRINIAFEPTSYDEIITIHDEYGSKLNFTFREEDINNIPKLNI